MRWLQTFWRWLAAPVALEDRRVVEDDGDDWYAGLAVDPRGFSEQLCKLQNALLAAGGAGQDRLQLQPVGTRETRSPS